MTDNDRPMPVHPQSSLAEPLRAKLSDADDRIRLYHWMPPQQWIAPRIRIGRRWINTPIVCIKPSLLKQRRQVMRPCTATKWRRRHRSLWDLRYIELWSDERFVTRL